MAQNYWRRNSPLAFSATARFLYPLSNAQTTAYLFAFFPIVHKNNRSKHLNFSEYGAFHRRTSSRYSCVLSGLCVSLLAFSIVAGVLFLFWIRLDLAVCFETLSTQFISLFSSPSTNFYFIFVYNFPLFSAEAFIHVFGDTEQ